METLSHNMDLICPLSKLGEIAWFHALIPLGMVVV
jgi:hypothetical protein